MNSPLEPNGKCTVLVVDDTPENLQLMHGLLREQYRVRLATSGEIALDGERQGFRSHRMALVGSNDVNVVATESCQQRRLLDRAVAVRRDVDDQRRDLGADLVLLCSLCHDPRAPAGADRALGHHRRVAEGAHS